MARKPKTEPSEEYLWVPAKEAAAILQVTCERIYSLCKEGRIQRRMWAKGNYVYSVPDIVRYRDRPRVKAVYSIPPGRPKSQARFISEALFLPVTEVAARMGCSRRNVERLGQEGVIQRASVRDYSGFLYAHADVERLMAKTPSKSKGGRPRIGSAYRKDGNWYISVRMRPGVTPRRWARRCPNQPSGEHPTGEYALAVAKDLQRKYDKGTWTPEGGSPKEQVPTPDTGALVILRAVLTSWRWGLLSATEVVQLLDVLYGPKGPILVGC